MAAIDKSQEVIDGTVWLTLYKGNVMITGRESPSSLYDQELSSMDIEGGFDQQDSAGLHQHQRHPADGPQRHHEQAGQEGHGFHEERPVSGTVWAERFAHRKSDPTLDAFNASVGKDLFLFDAEIKASAAYARGLGGRPS